MRDATPTSRDGRQETDESHDDNTTLPLTRRRALQALGAAAGAASITGGSTAADGGTLAGPHATPDPLSPAGDDEHTLFQAPLDGGNCRVAPPGGRTGIESYASQPTGAVRVWLIDAAEDDPTATVTVAVEDAREVVTISAAAWPDADTLRDWGANLRHRSDDCRTVASDAEEVSIHSRGGGAEVRDRDSNGSLHVNWTTVHTGVAVGVTTDDSWAEVFVADTLRDELATAAETAAEVIDDE